jgi:hypothetical protein
MEDFFGENNSALEEDGGMKSKRSRIGNDEAIKYLWRLSNGPHEATARLRLDEQRACLSPGTVGYHVVAFWLGSVEAGTPARLFNDYLNRLPRLRRRLHGDALGLLLGIESVRAAHGRQYSGEAVDSAGLVRPEYLDAGVFLVEGLEAWTAAPGPCRKPFAETLGQYGAARFVPGESSGKRLSVSRECLECENGIIRRLLEEKVPRSKIAKGLKKEENTLHARIRNQGLAA